MASRPAGIVAIILGLESMRAMSVSGGKIVGMSLGTGKHC
jgi:hypothetical protein